MKIKLKLIKIHWFLSNQIGIDFIKLYNFTKSIPFYFIDLLIFKKQYKGKIDFYHAYMISLKRLEKLKVSTFGKIYWSLRISFYHLQLNT